MERALTLGALEGAGDADPVVVALRRGELRCFAEVASSLALVNFATSSEELVERENLKRWLTAAQSSGRIYC